MFSSLLVMTVAMLEAPDEVAKLVARNDANLAKVRTLRAEVETRQSLDGGKTWQVFQTHKIVRSGRREHVRVHSEGASYQGKWVPDVRDQTILHDPAEIRSLVTFPEKIGGMSPPVLEFAGGWSNDWKSRILLAPDYSSYQKLLTSQGTVLEVQAAPKNDPQADQRVMFRPTDQRIFRTIELWFSPAHGGLVTKRRTRFVNPDSSTPQAIHSTTSEIVDFHVFKGGIVLPKTLQAFRDDEPNLVAQVELRDVVCNAPIDDDELRLPFPRGIVVVDYRSNTYHLWGGNAPARTFKSPREFQLWDAEQQRSKAKPAPFYARTPVLVAAVCLVMVAVLLLIRKRLARA